MLRLWKKSLAVCHKKSKLSYIKTQKNRKIHLLLFSEKQPLTDILISIMLKIVCYISTDSFYVYKCILCVKDHCDISHIFSSLSLRASRPLYMYQILTLLQRTILPYWNSIKCIQFLWKLWIKHICVRILKCIFNKCVKCIIWPFNNK